MMSLDDHNFCKARFRTLSGTLPAMNWRKSELKSSASKLKSAKASSSAAAEALSAVCRPDLRRDQRLRKPSRGSSSLISSLLAVLLPALRPHVLRSAKAAAGYFVLGSGTHVVFVDVGRDQRNQGWRHWDAVHETWIAVEIGFRLVRRRGHQMHVRRPSICRCQHNVNPGNLLMQVVSVGRDIARIQVERRVACKIGFDFARASNPATGLQWHLADHRFGRPPDVGLPWTVHGAFLDDDADWD